MNPFKFRQKYIWNKYKRKIKVYKNTLYNFYMKIYFLENFVDIDKSNLVCVKFNINLFRKKSSWFLNYVVNDDNLKFPKDYYFKEDIFEIIKLSKI